MIPQVISQIISFGPYSENSRVVLACSGGADSTFLAHAYKRASQTSLLPTAIVAVIDHAQHEQSREQTAKVVDGYHRLGFEVVSQRISCDRGINENDMRNQRYAALLEIAKHHQASKVFVAHHAEDQAETILQRIMRGTGINGLVGMRPSRDMGDGIELCRPLLNMRRDEMRAYLSANKMEWLEDQSNSDVEYATRNKIRHQLLPQLGEIATGDPIKALTKLAGEAADWESAQQQLLGQDHDFAEVPSYLRRQAVRAELLKLGEKVTPQRLLDIEGALIKKGSAVINTALRFSTSGGKLLVVARR